MKVLCVLSVQDVQESVVILVHIIAIVHVLQIVRPIALTYIQKNKDEKISI